MWSMVRVVVCCGLVDREWTVATLTENIGVQDLYLDEPFEYIE